MKNELALTRPVWAVKEIFPVYCRITDGLIGSSSRIVAAAGSQRHAELTATRLSILNDVCGDSSFEVVCWNGEGWRRAIPMSFPAEFWGPFGTGDDIPF